MKCKKFLKHFYLYILLLILGNFKCKEKNECINNSNFFKSHITSPYLSADLSSLNENNLNEQMNLNSCPGEIMKNINPGNVETILLFRENIYNFAFNSINNKNGDELFVNFYSLDSKIQITEENENLSIERIKYFEYDAFFIRIKIEQLNNINIKIRPLINSINDYNRNRTFHLIINSFEYIKNNTNLIIKEKEPIFLNFNNNTINKINLIYNLINKDISSKSPISISFFIKERVKFIIKVYNDYSKELCKKTVSYLDRILIDREEIPNKPSYINISIEKFERKEAIMVVKVIEDYTTPIYFQKNILNIGFIPSSVSYQYYYMEVFEGEHGEIILNNKRYNGMLISKIITKEEANETNILYNSESYPKDEKEKNNILQYSEYSQNITFNSEKTNKCREGCYLLITYFSIYFNKTYNTNIIGTEFTLLGRIFDEEEEFRSQIINIPLNEYIFGSIKVGSIKIHYYSLYIPENNNIELETNLNNIAFSIKKGVKKINYNSKYPINLAFSEYFIYNITPSNCNLESFEGQYITFAFSSYISLANAYYYFRVLQENSNSTNITPIYPLDTNKANLCNPSFRNGKYSCLFLIDNIYKDLYNDLIIYAYGKEKVDYKAWHIENNENDLYSLNFENLEHNQIENENNNFLKINGKFYINSKYILINIETLSNETLTILSHFYDNKCLLPHIYIYSYQLFYLNSNENLTINLDNNSNNQYRYLIKHILGQGKIETNPPDINNNRALSGKIIFSFPIKNEMKNIHIFNPSGQLVFNIKVENELNNPIFEDLQFYNDYSLLKKEFPIRFILREIDYTGADINFFFINKINQTLIKDDLIIKGYGIKYDIMKLISELKLIKPDIGEEIKGIFDNRTNMGLIVFDKEILENNNGIDFYYLIEIESNNINLDDLMMDIYATSKNSSQFSIPYNKYIAGSFNLKNNKNQKQKYLIKEDDIENYKKYIIELSSNYKNVNLTFDDKNIIEFSEERKEVGGITKYFVKFTGNENYFHVNVFPGDVFDDNHLNTANYIIRYFETDIQEKDFELDINGEIKNENNNQYLKINIKAEQNYTFTAFFYLYKRDSISVDELINTTAPTELKGKYIDSSFFSNESSKVFYLSKSIIPEEYKGMAFIIVEDNKMEGGKSYYSYEFDINPEKKNDKKNIIAGVLVSIIIVSIIIIIIIFIFNYRNIKKKNKDLEEQIKSISFSENSNDDDENSDIVYI